MKLHIFIALFFITFFIGCGQDPQKASNRKKELIESGRQLYLGNGCAVCHGKEGLGNGLNAERYYPRPINLTDPSAYKLGASVAAIQQTIKKGIQKENSAMPAYDHLTQSELQAIAAFLESIQVKENDLPTKETNP